MALDWKNGKAKLKYGHVVFKVEEYDGGYWLPEIRLGNTQVWEDDFADHSLLMTQEAAQLRAEHIYSEQAGGWVAADLTAEVLNRVNGGG